MDGGEVVVEKWVRGNPAAADFEKVLIVRMPSGRYEVRHIRAGRPAGRPVSRPNFSQALAAAMTVMTADWRREPADTSPPTRYGRGPSVSRSRS